MTLDLDILHLETEYCLLPDNTALETTLEYTKLI